MDTLEKDFELFCQEHNVTPQSITWMINRAKDKAEEDKIRNKVAENKVFTGRCYKKRVKPYHGMFPEMWRYYKVVSERASTPSLVTCLVFDELPWYFFDYPMHKMHCVGDYFLGTFDFRGIQTDEILTTKFETYTEIDEDEYNLALHNYTQELIDMKWYPDHYRMGGKLPSDDDWERKE